MSIKKLKKILLHKPNYNIIVQSFENEYFSYITWMSYISIIKR